MSTLLDTNILARAAYPNYQGTAMEVEYTLRPEDLMAFARYYRKLRSVQPSFSWIAILGFVAIMIVEGLSLLFAHIFFKEEDPWFSMLIGAFLVILLQGWWHTCWYRAFYKALCEDPRSEWAVRNVQVVISADQLRTVARGATTIYHWSVIWHIGVTHKQIFLFTTRTTAIIIPRRAFRDTAHCEEFVALARQYRQDCRETKQKPSGIITSLLPESTAIIHPDVS